MKTTEAFERAFERVLRHEGGFVDHPTDPGGATRYGITERVARARGYTGHMRELPIGLAREIYHADYWRRVRGDELPAAVACDVFDTAANLGPAQAVRLVQRTLGVKDDGILGPVTISALHDAEPARFLSRFAGERLAFYAALPTWPSFGRGWVRRVAANLRDQA